MSETAADIPLRNITFVAWQSEMRLGAIVISIAEGKTEIKNVDQKDGKVFVDEACPLKPQGRRGRSRDAWTNCNSAWSAMRYGMSRETRSTPETGRAGPEIRDEVHALLGPLSRGAFRAELVDVAIGLEYVVALHRGQGEHDGRTLDSLSF